MATSQYFNNYGSYSEQRVIEDLIVESTQSRWVAVRLQVPYDSATPGSYPVRFIIEASDEAETVHTTLEEKSVFLIPR